MANNPDLAIPEFEQTIKLSPQESEAHVGLARCYIHKHNWTGALASLRTAEKISPNDPDLHHRLGQVLNKLQKPDLAVFGNAKER